MRLDKTFETQTSPRQTEGHDRRATVKGEGGEWGGGMRVTTIHPSNYIYISLVGTPLSNTHHCQWNSSKELPMAFIVMYLLYFLLFLNSPNSPQSPPPLTLVCHPCGFTSLSDTHLRHMLPQSFIWGLFLSWLWLSSYRQFHLCASSKLVWFYHLFTFIL